MLRAKLNDALKEAMKAKKKRAVSTLRLILAALKDRDIAQRTQGADRRNAAQDRLHGLTGRPRPHRRTFAGKL